MTSPHPRPDATRADPVGFGSHDHAHCVHSAVAEAEARCAAEGLRFTPVRRAALECLLKEHRALGAYEVLDRLREGGFGSQPPVAYRALEVLRVRTLSHGTCESSA